MVYVPAGYFLMGSSDSDPYARDNEKPQHRVYVDAFWIDKTEVSRAMFAKFIKETGYKPSYYTPQTPNDPANYATWQDANAYCIWAGRRLPTEAEWEKAARGTDGRIYPWGNSPPTVCPPPGMWCRDLDYKSPALASPYGALSMAGGVREWVADWYDSNYYRQSPSQNPLGPTSGSEHVVRGGSWNDDIVGLRSAYRMHGPDAILDGATGFRCALSATE
jgi:formylglycine-generating enzyme required for sulfatase activity